MNPPNAAYLAKIEALERENAELLAVLITAHSDIKAYLEWLMRNGRMNSELHRIGTGIAIAIERRKARKS